MVTPYHPDQLPGFTALLYSIQGICTGWIAIVTLKEFMTNNLEYISDREINPLVIIKNNIIATVLVWVSPLLVTQLILPMVGDLQNLITATGSLGDLSNLTNNMDKALTLNPGGTAVIGLVGAVNSDLTFWPAVVIVLAILIVVVIVGISSGQRWVELFYLILISPILATSKASFSGYWDVWLKQTISCAASQALQLFSVILGFSMLLNAGSVNAIAGNPVSLGGHLFIGIGACFFAVKGPTYLRQIIMGGNPTGVRAVSSMASQAQKLIP